MDEEWQNRRLGSTSTGARRAGPWPAAVAAFLLLAAGEQAALADEACAHRPAAVVRVDPTGDLMLADGTAVRLAGIELPPDGGPALAEIAELAGAGGVTLAGEELPDRYNRIHAMVFLGDGLSLQWNLVADGLARVRLLPGEHLCGENLLLAEDAARIGRFGLWAGHEYAIWRADDPSLLKQIGLYALVEGRVVSVGAGSRIVFLDFGRIWRRDFTVMVAASEAARFAAAGKKLESLANRTIRVRGVVEENNGPAIRIDNPDAIEVLDDDVK